MAFGIPAPQFDAVVKTDKKRHFISIQLLNSPNSKLCSEFAELKKIGIAAYHYECWQPTQDIQIFFNSAEYDTYELAERFALSLENDFGMKVQRLIPDPDRADKSLSKPVQSFLLV